MTKCPHHPGYFKTDKTPCPACRRREAPYIKVTYGVIFWRHLLVYGRTNYVRLVYKCPTCGRKPTAGPSAPHDVYMVGHCRQWFGSSEKTARSNWNEFASAAWTNKT